MDFERLSRLLEPAQEALQVLVAGANDIKLIVEDALTDIKDILEEAQPPAESGPVVEDEVSLQDKVDYIYSKVGETIGFSTGESERQFKNALMENEPLVNSVYQQYQTEEAGSAFGADNQW